MEDHKTPNTQFFEDIKLDIQTIHTYFLQSLTIPNLDSIYYQFSLDCIANPVLPKSKEFINAFFISITCCIYQATIKDDLPQFILLIYLLKSVYFNQTKTNVQISISYEKLVTINEYIEYAKVKCETTVNLNMCGLLNYCVKCLDALKYYCAFDVYIDKDSNCLPVEDSKLIMKDMEMFENQLEDLEKYLETLLDDEDSQD